MAKIGFYVKAASLLLTLAVSSLAGCSGESFSSADSDAGVTNDVTPEATGGRSSVITSQTVRSTGGQTSSQSSATGGQSSVISTRSEATGGTTSTPTNYAITYHDTNRTQLPYTRFPRDSSGTALFGTCPAGEKTTACACFAGDLIGSLDAFSAFDVNCSDYTLSQCISNSAPSTGTGLTMDGSDYTYVWQCGVVSTSIDVSTGGSSAVLSTGGSSSVLSTGGASSLSSTGGSSTIAATGGSAPSTVVVAPTTYSVTYQNQVASQSIQAPGTCPLGQNVAACTCVISGMQSTLTSCNPTACAIENSKQYPQSTFTWTCV